MSETNGKRSMETAEQRRTRLAAELRANLQKRKAQARARARQKADDAPQPPAGSDGGDHA
jgi:hypothetical protein